MWQQDVYRMIQRRARGVGITAFLKNNGGLETVHYIAQEPAKDENQ